MSTAKFHSYEAASTSTADAARLAVEIIQTHPEITWTEAYLNGEENRLVVAGVIDDTHCELRVTPVCCGIIDAQTRDTVGVLAETEAFEETDALLRIASSPSPDTTNPRHSTYRFIASTERETEEP